MLAYLRYGPAQIIVCAAALTRTEAGDADQTFYFTQSQYTDTGPTSPSVDPTTPGAGVSILKSLVGLNPENPGISGIEPWVCHSRD